MFNWVNVVENDISLAAPRHAQTLQGEDTLSPSYLIVVVDDDFLGLPP